MTKIEEVELEFYKNGSAKSVLSRFHFTDEETKLIQDAIRTANMDHPRIALIHQADALLKEVAKTREPILPENKSAVSAEALAKIELLKHNTAMQQEVVSTQKNSRAFFGFKSKSGIVAVIVITLGMIAVQYFQHKPMNDRIQQQENLLDGKR